MNPQLSNFIALARWVAAAMVLLGHVGAMIQVPDIMVAPHGPLVYAWWFLTAFSHQAVLIFFVISGFLVGGDVLRKRARAEPFLRDYMINRFARIYIVMVPALAWGFLLDSLGRRIFPHSGIYDAPFFEGVFNLENILGALLQQQTIWTPQAGTNGPLWSLACEIWYYVTFPLLLLPLSSAYSKRFKAAAFAFGALAAIAMSVPKSPFLFGYVVWAGGAAIRLAPRPLIRRAWMSLTIFLATITVVRLAARGALVETHPIVATLADVATASSFANLLLSLRFAGQGGLFSRLGAMHARFSDFSYSLYATHAPLVFFVWAGTGSLIAQDWHKRQPTPLHWGLGVALIAASVAFAYAFSRATEARTPELRGYLRRVLPRRPTRAMASKAEAPV
ncbi:MAG TPA: acyltransferase family protein [Methylocystis sp.]|nr:acyltransferase family protein [Methylocystis sp.]